MNNRGKLWTLRYTLINVTYFAAFCTVHAYAAVFLLDSGFTNTEIGILLAVANVLSALFQPLVAAVIDRQGFFTNRNVMMICAGMIAGGAVVLLFAGSVKPVVFIVFTMMYMVQFTYMPVMTALNFEYQRGGAKIFYGLARGLGSAGFAVTSAIIGTVVENEGVRVLLYVTIAVMALHAVIVYFFRLPTENENAAIAENNVNIENEDVSSSEAQTKKETGTSNSEKKNNESSSIPEFIKRYPAFMLMLVATVFLFFTHNMLNDYLIQILRPLGGGESELGIATFLAAVLELPTMAVITLVSKKVSMKLMLVVAGVSFTVKAVIMLLAANIPVAYVSQAMQMLAYAVFIPAAAYYVSENIAENDQVKGQAFVTSCFTLAGVFSSLVCGIVLDSLGVTEMLIIGVAVSSLGTLLIMCAMKMSPKNAAKHKMSASA